MLSAQKLKKVCEQRQVNSGAIATHLATGGRKAKDAAKAIKNWRNGLFNPKPSVDDITKIASVLSVQPAEIMDWCSSCRYAPFSARKARLVTQLIVGLPAQEAMDVLKFTSKRAAPMIGKLIKCAIADADEQQASVDSLYVKEARVDDAGIRLGTKRWIAKDRGRAHPIRKKACHIHVTLTQE